MGCHRNWVNSHFFSTEETISMRELLAASIYLAESGGAELVKIRQSSNLNTKEKTGKNDLVTAGDHASHDIMFNGMRSTFPKLTVISEEGDDIKNGAPPSVKVPLSNSKLDRILVSDELIPIEDITVWIDPLDATKEYTEGISTLLRTIEK